MLFHRDLADNLNVCLECDHHLYIKPRERFTALFDDGQFREITPPDPIVDPPAVSRPKEISRKTAYRQKANGRG